MLLIRHRCHLVHQEQLHLARARWHLNPKKQHLGHWQKWLFDLDCRLWLWHFHRWHWLCRQWQYQIYCQLPWLPSLWQLQNLALLVLDCQLQYPISWLRHWSQWQLRYYHQLLKRPVLDNQLQLRLHHYPWLWLHNLGHSCIDLLLLYCQWPRHSHLSLLRQSRLQSHRFHLRWLYWMSWSQWQLHCFQMCWRNLGHSPKKHAPLAWQML